MLCEDTRFVVAEAQGPVTGIAGPDGGSEDKPMGTAWIGFALHDGAIGGFRVFHLRNRKDFKLAGSQSAWETVRRRLNALDL